MTAFSIWIPSAAHQTSVLHHTGCQSQVLHVSWSRQVWRTVLLFCTLQAICGRACSQNAAAGADLSHECKLAAL